MRAWRLGGQDRLGHGANTFPFILYIRQKSRASTAQRAAATMATAAQGISGLAATRRGAYFFSQELKAAEDT